jgi:phosphoserine phosphatase
MAESVLTIVTQAADAAAAADRAARALGALGARVDAPLWLAPDTACDIPFDGLDPDAAMATRAALAGLPVDLIAQPAAGRRKRLILADMESTIIANEMLDEIADLAGLKERIAAVTARAMNGEIDFADALRERVALLRDLPESALAAAGARIRIDPGAAALIATMRANGAYAALVSGGFNIYADRIGAMLGFDAVVANEIEVSGGRLTGKVREPIVTAATKLASLQRLASERGLPLAATLAVGDGANDLPMIEAAGLGVAYHGKPALAARARARIDHADLTALLYFQGYRREEFVGQR